MKTEMNGACGQCADAQLTDRAADGIGRRTFLAQSALLAASALLASCMGGDIATAPTTISPTTLKASDYPSLATVGGIALVSISGAPMAVVRTSATTFVTLSRVCPHQGNIVNQNGNGFLCPGHGARFAADGTWIGGERTGSLRSYTTAYDSAAGTITVG